MIFLETLHGRVPPGLRHELAVGKTVRFTPVQRLQGNVWMVRIGDRFLSVRSHVPLPLGIPLSARVTGKGNTIRFILNPPQYSVDGHELQDLSDDPVTRLVVGAFLREGLALEPERIAFIKTYLSREKRETSFIARMLSILVKKGFDGDVEYITALIKSIERSQPREEHGDSFVKDHKKKGMSMKDRLKASVIQAEERDDALTLFNHIAQDDASWVILPFDFSHDSSSLKGHLSLLLRSSDRKVVSALLSVKEPLPIDVAINGETGKRRITIQCGDEATAQRVRNKERYLGEILRKMGTEIDDIIVSTEYSDGFSIGKPFKMPSFDTIV